LNMRTIQERIHAGGRWGESGGEKRSRPTNRTGNGRRVFERGKIPGPGNFFKKGTFGEKGLPEFRKRYEFRIRPRERENLHRAYCCEDFAEVKLQRISKKKKRVFC